MRRWHQERELMLRRWREEIGKHEQPYVPRGYLAPVPPAADGECHCFRGMGFLRKKSPYDCGNPKCYWCHYMKLVPKNRSAKRRKAIEENMAGWGIV